MLANIKDKLALCYNLMWNGDLELLLIGGCWVAAEKPPSCIHCLRLRSKLDGKH